MKNGKLDIYKKNITSEHGEDGILEYLLSVVGESVPKVLVEVGAWDGVFGSNTYTLWKALGWKAVLIEGQPDKFLQLEENTKDAVGVVCVNRFITAKGRDSLDSIFNELSMEPDIGIISIDIDSFDYYVWKYLDYINPSIVVIEHNQEIPPYIDYFDPEGAVYFRCSAKALERLGGEKGYKLVSCTTTNCIFIQQSLFDSAVMPDLPVEALFDYSRLAPQAMFSAMNDNKYPVFTRKTSSGVPALIRFYYYLESIIIKKKKYIRPSREVAEHMRKLGLDP
ncbi:hypothetical protein [Acidihalobacter prosperus]|uniref:hypothetical protein n=1 Tax=Acidihalobacter prosperus TaxID=160660 RepID=UPI000503BACE|nr:hypothetical protein [Acidihalobacter prosperus]